jgi:hypothetical protein
MMQRLMLVLAFSLAAFSWAAGRAPGADVPRDFPRFVVPGHQAAMDALRELYWLHYPGAGPKATMWDAWLPMCSLWPATDGELRDAPMRNAWRGALAGRKIDAEGYVSTHQHYGLAHRDGWPFPLWNQGGGMGWQFSLAGCPYGQQYGIALTPNMDLWQLSGAKDLGTEPNRGRRIALASAGASLTTPPFSVAPLVAPFVRIEWRAEGLPATARPYLEWTTSQQPQFAPERRIAFQPAGNGPEFTFTHIPTHRHPQWSGTITRLRIGFDNPPGALVTLATLITACDSRHNINNTRFVRGCADLVAWTGDFTWLRDNVARMRRAIRYALDEFQVRQYKCVFTPWVGHDGRSGLTLSADGRKTIRPGLGVGNNYWDLLPCGGKDCLATIYLYDALLAMADIERHIAAHPEWSIAAPPDEQTQAALRGLAQEVKAAAGKLFWNASTGRFVAAIDVDGAAHDYGFVFVNCEAIYHGFATPEQARSIVDWLSGKRIVAGDTSQAADIYHWRFGPRATTRRNVDYYFWAWSAPESIPFGGQVQDGGGVLGFAFHDLMARLSVNGPDDAWQRLRATADWFSEVRKAGGYRAYYADGKRGSLQGNNTPGGLGLDAEFFESALVPQTLLYGFLGFRPTLDGFSLDPKLPRDWPSLAIDRIGWRDAVLAVEASRDRIQIRFDRKPARPFTVTPPSGRWTFQQRDAKGKPTAPATTLAPDRPAVILPNGPAVQLEFRCAG